MTGESRVVEQSCVLVVDDEQDIRETLSELVEMAGHQRRVGLDAADLPLRPELSPDDAFLSIENECGR